MRMAITPENVSLQQIRDVCSKPIDVLQLRAKRLDGCSFYFFAKECRKITRSRGIQLIINDRFDIALSIEADGIHLPQNGLPPAIVKKLCPFPFLIGVSTHTDQEALDAFKQGASYITFSSTTKGRQPNVVDLQAIAKKIAIPILALGNIQESSIATYINAGAKGYAAMRMFFS